MRSASSSSSRVGELRDGHADRVEAREVLLRRDHGVAELAPFVRDAGLRPATGANPALQQRLQRLRQHLSLSRARCANAPSGGAGRSSGVGMLGLYGRARGDWRELARRRESPSARSGLGRGHDLDLGAGDGLAVDRGGAVVGDVAAGSSGAPSPPRPASPRAWYICSDRVARAEDQFASRSDALPSRADGDVQPRTKTNGAAKTNDRMGEALLGTGPARPTGRARSLPAHSRSLRAGRRGSAFGMRAQRLVSARRGGAQGSGRLRAGP